MIADGAGCNSTDVLGSCSCMVYGADTDPAAAGSWNSCRGHLWLAHNDMANVGFCDGHAKVLPLNGDTRGDTTASRSKYWMGGAQ